MSEFDYEKKIHIDETSLDLEWLDQPKNFHEIAKESAEAVFNLDQAKASFDVTCAELEMDIRNNPGNYKIEKVTESAIKAALCQTEKHQRALLELNEAKRDAAILQGAVRSFDQKKSALENLVRLQGQSYFAGPSIPRDIEHELQLKEAKSNRVNNKIATRIKRKKGKEA